MDYVTKLVAQRRETLRDSIDEDILSVGSSIQAVANVTTNLGKKFVELVALDDGVPGRTYEREQFTTIASVLHDWAAQFTGLAKHGEPDVEVIEPNPLLVDLRLAAETLRGYEQHHRAKGTEDSLKKAEVNATLAARFEATIAKAEAA